jgi:hypothetical protein
MSPIDAPHGRPWTWARIALIVLIVVQIWLTFRALSERSRIDQRISTVQLRQEDATRRTAAETREATCAVVALYLQPSAVPTTAYGQQLATAYRRLGTRLHCSTR